MPAATRPNSSDLRLRKADGWNPHAASLAYRDTGIQAHANIKLSRELWQPQHVPADSCCAGCPDHPQGVTAQGPSTRGPPSPVPLSAASVRSFANTFSSP
eukprot:GHUV01032314.1.p2 GENE.GHUV01032314.1~~GHUV01032314.1.p2  ORF type:complete len:100 (+),score=27.13 GHUV01032314.1:780-1079(+)